MKKRKAYTLAEAVVVMIFVGIFAAIAIPRFNFAVVEKYGAQATARKIAADLRRSRMLAISNAAQNTDGYQLKMVGSSPYSQYQIINLDTLAVIDTHTIDEKLTCTGDSTFQFGPIGNLKAGSGTQLRVAAPENSFTIDVIQATGSIKCSADQ